MSHGLLLWMEFAQVAMDTVETFTYNILSHICILTVETEPPAQYLFDLRSDLTILHFTIYV